MYCLNTHFKRTNPPNIKTTPSSKQKHRPEIELTPVKHTPKLTSSGDAVWDPDTERVYYFQYLDNKVYAYSPSKKKTYKAEVEDLAICFMFPISSALCDEFLLGANGTLYIMKWDVKKNYTKITSTLQHVKLNSNSVFDVAITDSHCGIYFGTFNIDDFCNARHQLVYYYSKKHGLKQVLSNTSTTSGMIFDKSTQTLFCMDGCEQTITAYRRKENGDLCKLIFLFLNIAR